MKLYVFPPSPNAIKVLFAAHHLELPFETEIVDLFGGGQNAPEFAARNPNRKMPVLEDDGFVLWESNAILQYLASKKPESGLWPSAPRAQADVSRWQFWQLAHWSPTCGVLVFERVVKKLAGLGPTDESAVEKAMPDFHKYAAVLNGALAGRKWLAGDTLTVADASVGAWMVYGGQAGYPLDAYPEIPRWYAQLVALPSWGKAVPRD